MAGIYLHIPFCRKACTYCDFHFSTGRHGREPLLAAMHQELDQRAGTVQDTVGTIYFGGGTPSLLDPAEVDRFMVAIRARYKVLRDAEVTLEANPDDITAERLSAWKGSGITRISLGTQSFREERLRFMGRAHTAEQALRSIALIAKADLASWSIDLIYGLPNMTMAEWDEQLTIAIDHGMPHLSAYCLTVEARTALAHQVTKGLVQMPGDDAQSAQFDRLMDRMSQAGSVHYEISNFGREGHFSRHNTSYWEGAPYLGIGPSAHSFTGRVRRWNVANNARYVTGMKAGRIYWEQEELTAAQRTNELLMTGLRTNWGVAVARLEIDALARNKAVYQGHVDAGLLRLDAGHLVLTRTGRHFADRIASDLFVTDDDR